MKKLFLISCVVLLSGCFYQSVDDNDIALGKLYCESKGSEIKNIEVWWNGSEKVHCKNNDWTNLHILSSEEINKLKNKG